MHSAADIKRIRKANHVLRERILLVTMETALTPTVKAAARLAEVGMGGGVTRVVVRYGFSESPDLPAALAKLSQGIEPVLATHFLGRQTLIPARRPGLRFHRSALFAAMFRNSQSSMSHLRLLANRVVELGIQGEI